MIAELGHYALILALCMALVQSILPIAGAARGNAAWMAVARPAALAQFLTISIAFGALAWAFISNDFSVAYVARNSNLSLPLQYRISAVWGSHEGSLLLWVFILSIWGMAVAIFSRSLPRETAARVLGVMGLIGIGFLLFMLMTSNPFERLFPAPFDGRDLNPLLQDPGLVIHPPMLYMGYVGFSVAFAFAIAALLGGSLDATWARWSRPWTTVAWMFLTIGITLGSWWAYYELGWGGWWFWDPVENASFMPWLVGTALIHSLAVTEKRGAAKNWTLLLAIFAFSLSLLGTFLVRSGVLTSVHAFATDPERGIFILAFLGVVVGGSLMLYAWRAPAVKSAAHFAPLSRETLLLSNGLLFVVAAASVLLGTIYPLVMDAFNLGKISVGPPYFNAVFVPLMIPVVFLMAVGPLTRWKQQALGPLVKQLRFVMLASILLGGLMLVMVTDTRPVMVGVALALAFWVLIASFMELRRKLNNKADLWSGLKSLRTSYYGMLVAHLGIAVTMVGIACTSYFSIEKDVRLAPGEVLTISGYGFSFHGVQDIQGPNYIARRGEIQVERNGKLVALLHPEKRVYQVQQNPMTEAGIDAGFFRDLYVALGEPLNDGAWSVRVYVKPFVRWIWLGGLIMAFGGFLAVIDRRYRMAVPVTQTSRATGSQNPIKGEA